MDYRHGTNRPDGNVRRASSWNLGCPDNSDVWNKLQRYPAPADGDYSIRNDRSGNELHYLWFEFSGKQLSSPATMAIQSRSISKLMVQIGSVAPTFRRISPKRKSRISHYCLRRSSRRIHLMIPIGRPMKQRPRFSSTKTSLKTQKTRILTQRRGIVFLLDQCITRVTKLFG